ncbi:MAG TPA: hypothetical protein VHA30_01070 [Patescibacteria group bacterium]|nr:hypothetical protein [Patescibacteria group bacterium]
MSETKTHPESAGDLPKDDLGIFSTEDLAKMKAGLKNRITLHGPNPSAAGQEEITDFTGQIARLERELERRSLQPSHLNPEVLKAMPKPMLLEMEKKLESQIDEMEQGKTAGQSQLDQQVLAGLQADLLVVQLVLKERK